MAADGAGIDSESGGSIKLTIPVKNATLLDDSKCAFALVVELNRAELHEFIIRTSDIVSPDYQAKLPIKSP